MSASLTKPTRLMSTWVLCLLVSAVLWQRSEGMPAVSPTSVDLGSQNEDIVWVVPYQLVHNGQYHYYHHSYDIINVNIHIYIHTRIYINVYYYSFTNSLLFDNFIINCTFLIYKSILII